MNQISEQSSILPYHGVWPEVGQCLFMACGSRLVGDACLGSRVSIWFNAVVRGDVNRVTIGDECNIQDGAVVHCTYQKWATHIGDRVSIGHGAVVHGCTLADDVLVGMGAVVMDGAVVGAGSVVGARALVTQGQEIPPRSLVVGSPARVVRTLTPEESAGYGDTYKRYLQYVEGFSYPRSSLPAAVRSAKSGG